MQPTDTLIILGKGPSRRAILGMREQFPDASLWTLNNVFPEGSDPEALGLKSEQCSDLHFDVHHDRRFWGDFPKYRACVCSPFLTHPSPHVRPFPLEAIFAQFGHAYLECSFDFMVALACYEHAVGIRRLARICTPGACMLDPTHFAYRFGIHFWLGIAVGLGIKLEIPNPTALLQRKASHKVIHTDTEFPHIYGQPWSVTEPLAKKYNWHG